MRQTMRRRNGSAVVMAMILLVVLIAIAAGVGSTVTAAISVARNAQMVEQAQAAAESGVQVLKNYITEVKLSYSTSGQTIFEGLYDAIASSANYENITVASRNSGHPTSIVLPSSGWVRLYPGDNHAAFKATVFATLDTGNHLTGVTAMVTGWDGNSSPAITRTVSVDFLTKAQTGDSGVPPAFASNFLTYGSASFGGSTTIAAVQPLDPNKPKSLRLMVATASKPAISLQGTTIVGSADYPTQLSLPLALKDADFSQNPSYININTTASQLGGNYKYYNTNLNDWKNLQVANPTSDNDGKLVTFTTPPPLPQFDMSSFPQAISVQRPTDVNPNWQAWRDPLPTNTIPSGWANDTTVKLSNVTIPANFAGTSKGKPTQLVIEQNVVVTGVLYIAWPNRIQFKLPVTVQDGGCIVFQRNPNPLPNGQYGQTASFDDSIAQINFVNSVSYVGSSNSSSPAKGYSILAPDADIMFSQGPTDVTFAGSLVVARARLCGNSTMRINGGAFVVLSTTANALDGSGGSNRFYIRPPETASEAPVVVGNGGGASPSAIWFVYDPSGYTEGTGQ